MTKLLGHHGNQKPGEELEQRSSWKWGEFNAAFVSIHCKGTIYEELATPSDTFDREETAKLFTV